MVRATNPNILYLNLGKQLDTGDMKDVRAYLHKTHLAPAILDDCDSFPKICQRLEKKKKIIPKDFDFNFLSEMFEHLDMGALKDMVEEFVKENQLIDKDVTPSALKKDPENEYMEYVRLRDSVLHSLSIWENRLIPVINNNIKALKDSIIQEWKLKLKKHERDWNDILNEPKRVSGWQKTEWVKLAEKQKKEHEELAKIQSARIEAFIDGLSAEKREELARMQQSGRANGTVSESHSVPPCPKPSNC